MTPEYTPPNSDRFLRCLSIIGVGILLAIGVTRAVLWLGIALVEIPAPDQPFGLEGVSVHFAWRAQHSLPLYPRQEGDSYTVNYMGPCYFWTVGGIGRLLNADIANLFLIGRAITFLCGLGPAIIAAIYLRRHYGGCAGLAGLVFGLGSGPMIAYGVMCRPDMMADLLGAAGFFLACRNDRRCLPAAAVLLALACLTKQTAAVWLLAALVVLLFHQGVPRRACFWAHWLRWSFSRSLQYWPQ